ncbi:NAD(P)-binding domain-containing protein [uncultured Roseobacter sp.]|uniref:NADPH-dependent F420 reductase n=1 Tax=uncultured Roseobacter sp. TaxID=114847 RepID=UPI00262749D5|nr:NAD(P)-binding domain-containing protein [uncultured Roseobacter sp.]
MKIGIIGGGSIGRLYGRLWHQAGHEIFISSRNPGKLRPFAEGLGDRAYFGDPDQAVAFGDVILLAVNYPSVDDVTTAIRDRAAGKLVIDATNPLTFKPDGSLERTIPENEVAGLVMQSKLPGARVAKSFTSLWTGHVEQHSDVDTPSVAMPLAADVEADRKIVGTLVREAGLVPVDIGDLEASAALDPQSPIWNVVLSADEMRARIDTFRTRKAA